VTKLRATRFDVQIATKSRDLSLLRNVQTGSGATQPPIQWISREKSGWIVQMTQLQIVPWLRMCADILTLQYMPEYFAQGQLHVVTFVITFSTNTA